MMILGLDPGSHKTGYGIIKNDANDFSLVDYGCFITSTKETTAQRLCCLEKALTNLLKKFSPDLAAVEDLFFFKNHKTAVRVSQARGVILLALAKKNIPIQEPKPLEIKQALTGYGRAEKCQVQKMVAHFLKLEKPIKSDDAADALAAAICCAHNYNYLTKLNS